MLRGRRSGGVRALPRLRLVAFATIASLLPLGSYAFLTAAPAAADTAPTVTAVSPDVGPVAGGTAVTITGTGFIVGSTTVAFGTTPATDVTVTSDTTLTATAPPNPTGGSVDVVVTATDTVADSVGDQPRRPVRVRTAHRHRAESRCGPDRRRHGGDGHGHPFVPGASVSFGATAATDVTVTSATTLQATAPAGVDTGVVDVTVTTPGSDGGTSGTSPLDLYAYAAPTVTAIAPSTGLADTATSVTITGTDFSSVTRSTSEPPPPPSWPCGRRR